MNLHGSASRLTIIIGPSDHCRRPQLDELVTGGVILEDVEVDPHVGDLERRGTEGSRW